MRALPILILVAACHPPPAAGEPDAGPLPPVFDTATLDRAHLVLISQVASGDSCDVLAWCAREQPYDRLGFTAEETLVGQGGPQVFLFPDHVFGALQRYNGVLPIRVLMVAFVENADDPSLFADTCGIPAAAPFAWPVDEHALWALNASGERVVHHSCLTAHESEFVASGRDAQGRTFQEAMDADPHCSVPLTQAREEIHQSLLRQPVRPPGVTATNRCHRRDVDGGM